MAVRLIYFSVCLIAFTSVYILSLCPSLSITSYGQFVLVNTNLTTIHAMSEKESESDRFVFFDRKYASGCLRKQCFERKGLSVKKNRDILSTSSFFEPLEKLKAGRKCIVS